MFKNYVNDLNARNLEPYQVEIVKHKVSVAASVFGTIGGILIFIALFLFLISYKLFGFVSLVIGVIFIYVAFQLAKSESYIINTTALKKNESITERKVAVNNPQPNPTVQVRAQKSSDITPKNVTFDVNTQRTIKCAYCDLELFVVNNEISCPHCRYKKKVI